MDRDQQQVVVVQPENESEDADDDSLLSSSSSSDDGSSDLSSTDEAEEDADDDEVPVAMDGAGVENNNPHNGDDNNDNNNIPQPVPLNPNDDVGMQLSAEERQWALAIKQAITEEPELDNLSDFWYVQFALIDQDNVQLSVDRARRLQAFRQEYDLRDSYSVANRLFEDFLDLFPGHYMSLSYNETVQQGNYVLVFDSKKLYIATLRNQPGAMRTWLSAIYFVNHSMCPDFVAIRCGITIVNECEGFDWKLNYGIREFRQLWGEVCGPYPRRVHQIKNFHTGIFFNMLIAMGKKVLPSKMDQTFQLGCVCELGTLDQLYLVPNIQAAKSRVMEFFRNSIQRRFDNEAAFSL